jgi:hypothetical protein
MGIALKFAVEADSAELLLRVRIRTFGIFALAIFRHNEAHLCAVQVWQWLQFPLAVRIGASFPSVANPKLLELAELCLLKDACAHRRIVLRHLLYALLQLGCSLHHTD